MSSLSSKTPRSASIVAWVRKPLVRLSKAAGASVPLWLRTAKRDAVERASATTKNVTTDSFRIFIRSLLWRLGGRRGRGSPQGEVWVWRERSVSPCRGPNLSPLVDPWKEILCPRMAVPGARTMGRRLPTRSALFEGREAARRRVADLSRVRPWRACDAGPFSRSREALNKSAGAKRTGLRRRRSLWCLRPEEPSVGGRASNAVGLRLTCGARQSLIPSRPNVNIFVKRGVEGGAASVVLG